MSRAIIQMGTREPVDVSEDDYPETYRREHSPDGIVRFLSVRVGPRSGYFLISAQNHEHDPPLMYGEMVTQKGGAASALARVVETVGLPPGMVAQYYESQQAQVIE